MVNKKDLNLEVDMSISNQDEIKESLQGILDVVYELDLALDDLSKKIKEIFK